MSINVDGLDGLIARLDGLIDDNQTAKAMQKACLIVERAAKTNAKKGTTGDLRNSIKSKIETENGDITGIVYTPLEYAPYVEYGTGRFAENGGGNGGWWVYVSDKSSKGGKKKPAKRYTEEKAKQIVAIMRSKNIEAFCTEGREPKPFMRPALNDNREKILQILKEGVKND